MPDRKPVLVVCLIVFACMIGVGIVVPLLPFFGTQVDASPGQITALLGLFALGQLVATPLWGLASDRFGRKPIFLLALLGGTAHYVLLGIADTIALLLAARLLGGLMSGVIAVAFAVIADVAAAGSRARAMGLVSAAMALGLILGPAAGGLMAGEQPVQTDLQLIATAAGGLMMLAFLLALIYLRETRVRNEAGSPGHPVAGNLRSVVRTIVADPVLLRLNISHLLFAGSFAILDSTLALFASRRLNFNPTEIGYIYMSMALMLALSQSLVVSRLHQAIGHWQSILLGLLLTTTGFAVLALTEQLGVLLLGLACLALAYAAFFPTASSLATPPQAQGSHGIYLGVFQAAGNLGRFATPMFAGLVFSSFGAQAPFVVAALLTVPGILLLVRTSDAAAVRAAKVTPNE